MQAITSKDNPLVKRVRALARSSRECRKLGQTLLDGAHLIEAALHAGVRLEHLLLSDSGSHVAEHQALVERVECAVAVLPDPLFEAASPVDTPSGILAVLAIPAAPALSIEGSLLVLEEVQDAGNLGTILRTAAAAGIAQALLTPGCAQAWSPRVLRAGMGAHFALPIVENADVAAALAGFDGEIIATGLGPSTSSLFDCRLGGRVAWLFGSEGRGLSPRLAGLATQWVRVPMPGRMESLNVGAAAAICLFEQVRRCGSAK